MAGTVILMVFLEGSRFVREFLFFDISEVQMASLRFFIIGVGLILCILYRPNGIFGSASAEGK